MSKRGGSVKRKFSFELPKLKIGGKSEDKTSQSDRYSPPQTPKSVRPPLSPRTDNQLRLACAYVLQDFKPSHQVYEERYGRREEDKPRLSYPNVEKARGRKAEAADGSIIRRLSSRKHAAPAVPEKPDMKPTIKSQAFFEGLHFESNTMNAPPMTEKQKLDRMVDDEIRADIFNSNPPIASPAFFSAVDLERLQNKPLPAPERPVEVALPRHIGETVESRPFKRSMSSPLSLKSASAERGRKGPLSDSADTTASSPRTDGTENAWSNSTAPTTTAVTPARGSLNRASQTPGSEKFLTADIDWMRKELERHKRAQDEARAQLELENQVLASLGLEQRSSLNKPLPPTSGPLPSHKTLSGESAAPSATSDILSQGRSASQSIQQRRNVPPVPHLDSMQSQRLARSESRRQRIAPRSESQSELDMLRNESRISQDSRRNSQGSSVSRSTSRDIKNFFRNGSSDALAGGDTSTDMSRASSRSRRLFQINVRPYDGTGAPPGSLQSSKPQSRSRSIESIRSAVSGIAPSFDSAANKMRSWKSFSRSNDSGSDRGSTRLGTSLSKRQSHDTSRESLHSPEPRSKKGKSSINLNRELPPLPSLDQWRPEEEAEQPKHIVSMASPSHSSVHLSMQSPITAGHSPLDSQGDLSPGIINASATTSRIQSIYSRYSKITDSWRADRPAPSFSALASPAMPPEIIESILDSPLDSDGEVASTQPQSPFPPSPAYVAVEESSPQQLVPPSPAYLVVNDRQQRVPSEYMFRRNFGAVTPLPASPLPPESPQEQEMLAPPPANPKTIKRRTEDMFLPDLDARARSNSVDENAAATTPTEMKPIMRRQNTLPLLYKVPTNISTSSGKGPSHSKSQSEQVDFSRNTDTETYSRLYDMGYRNVVPVKKPQEEPRQEDATLGDSRAVDPATLPVRKESKRWWKRAPSVKKTKDSGTGLPQRSSSRMWKRDREKVGNRVGMNGVWEGDESAPTVVEF